MLFLVFLGRQSVDGVKGNPGREKCRGFGDDGRPKWQDRKASIVETNTIEEKAS